MPLSTTSLIGLYDLYLTCLGTADEVRETIRMLPDEHLPVKAFDEAFTRILNKIRDQVERGELPLRVAGELLDAIAGEP